MTGFVPFPSLLIGSQPALLYDIEVQEVSPWLNKASMSDTPPDILVTVANLFWALGIVAAVATSAVGATWAVLKQQIERLRDELAAYKGASDWKLPETLQSLNQLSDKLRLEIFEKEEFENLKDANKKLTADNEAKSVTLQGIEARASQLEEALTVARAPVADFQLAEGESEVLVKPHLILGLHNISSFNAASVIVAGNRYDLTVGDQKSVKHENRTYLLTLRGIDRKGTPIRAKFSFAPTS